MPTHITARLAWHDDGWNGSVCRAPERNTYCVGCKSFPGDVIQRERDLEAERALGGKSGLALQGFVPACSYSYNAFGSNGAVGASNPPDFFFGGATRKEWELPPATACVWPYEAMYGDEVRPGGRYDNDARHEGVIEFFKPVIADCGSNLVFYYANYSNPLSEEDSPRYVVIGASRILGVGGELFYENVSEKVARDYAKGMVWARNITSAWPDEGVRLPYHLYRDDPELLQRIALIPDNPALFKYGCKQLSDDAAIGLLEQLLDRVGVLIELGDESENWQVRREWLNRQISRLWTSRGIFPGLLRALEAAGAADLVTPVKCMIGTGREQEAYKLAFEALDAGGANELTASIGPAVLAKMSRNWRLLPEDGQRLLRSVLPRFDLTTQAMRAIALEGQVASAENIEANPYVIMERYCGSEADRIPFSLIDRGVLPSPELGAPTLAEMELNDARRLRALCVEHLRGRPNHTFRLARDLVAEIAARMDRLPGWKQADFTERYFQVDRPVLSEALAFQEIDEGLIVYIQEIFDDERTIEALLRDLAARPDIPLRRPVTDDDWKSWTFKPNTKLATAGGGDYPVAASEQAAICERIFRRPLAIVTGPAGTGKTTVIEALIRAVQKSGETDGTVLVLAPTGKAADRAREIFRDEGLGGVATQTIHSFLASNGWLNANFTFKREGGKRAQVATLVIDEASMLDLELAAALVRAIDAHALRRLVLVGDPGQLPPIGRGRVFADLIAWMRRQKNEGLGELRANLRQLLNRVSGNGQAILDLSSIFILDDENKAGEGRDLSTTLAQEELISRIHAGGRIDEDLEVIYWDDPAGLASTLIDAVERRMIASGAPPSDAPHQVWRAALEKRPTAFQVLTPHRGEQHGVEALNDACQERISKYVVDRLGVVDGITLFDKVIQVRNRPASNRIWAYNYATREQVQVEVFNGEIGQVQAMGPDRSLYHALKGGRRSWLKRFAVQFSGKPPGLVVNYGKGVPKKDRSGRMISGSESVEDNLELAYAVSIHKAQGSEFEDTFVVIPSGKSRPLSSELIYTAITRATRHCTLLIERDVTSLLDARRRENAQTPQINSSLFTIHLAREELLDRRGWYEAGKIHEALSGDMLRSKSEVIIANLLHEREVPFRYEQPLRAPDGTLRLPDFTVSLNGETWYWEHLGMLDVTQYAADWERKQAWYDRWFPGRLITSQEGAHLSREAAALLDRIAMAPTRPLSFGASA